MQTTKKATRQITLSEMGIPPKRPQYAREEFGVRFHHFLSKRNGRLVGTVVTVPDDTCPGQTLVACSVVFSGRKAAAEMVNGVIREIHDEAPPDVPTRDSGRHEAWRALLTGRVACMSTEDVRALIFRREIFEALFAASKGACPSTVRSSKLRPRMPPTQKQLDRSAAREARVVTLDDPQSSVLVSQIAEALAREPSKISSLVGNLADKFAAVRDRADHAEADAFSRAAAADLTNAARAL